MRLIDADAFAKSVVKSGFGAEFVNRVTALLIDTPPIELKQDEWVPCSKRLPEEGEYLVTAKKYAFDSSYYDVQIAYCSPNKKWFHIINCEIVAWMPIPKPWKGVSDE